jgi:NADH:ubiquinone oxidoreductase subunit 5 (subunit L)/multisubunit Na+/H+ antiporter MnhA subunit
MWSELCSFFQPAVMCSVLGSNVLLSVVFSEIINVCSFLMLGDQV